MHLGGLVGDLVHGQGDEVAEHDVHDRTHPRHGRADRQPRDAGFGDGRVDDPRRPELFHQAGQHFERRTGLCHVLPNDEHRGIPPHLLGQRLPHSLPKRNLTGGDNG